MNIAAVSSLVLLAGGPGELWGTGYFGHHHTAGPPVQGISAGSTTTKHVYVFECQAVATCPEEAAVYCNSTRLNLTAGAFRCHSFATTPHKNGGKEAQLYATDYNESIWGTSWSMWSLSDGPPHVNPRRGRARRRRAPSPSLGPSWAHHNRPPTGHACGGGKTNFGSCSEKCCMNFGRPGCCAPVCCERKHNVTCLHPARCCGGQCLLLAPCPTITNQTECAASHCEWTVDKAPSRGGGRCAAAPYLPDVPPAPGSYRRFLSLPPMLYAAFVLLCCLAVRSGGRAKRAWPRGEGETTEALITEQGRAQRPRAASLRAEPPSSYLLDSEGDGNCSSSDGTVAGHGSPPIYWDCADEGYDGDHTSVHYDSSSSSSGHSPVLEPVFDVDEWGAALSVPHMHMPWQPWDMPPRDSPAAHPVPPAPVQLPAAAPVRPARKPPTPQLVRSGARLSSPR
jgi:hypothetical protein